MKYTLLDLTQMIMASMESDEVNSITDTREAQDVALLVRTVYFDIINRANLPEQYSLFSLTASGDSTQPVLMTLPTDMRDMEWLKYNNATDEDTDLDMQPVFPLPLTEFITRMHQLKESDDEVETFTKVIGTSPVKFLYKNNAHPKFYTSYDDGTLIFNSYDASIDATLMSSKTLAYGQKNIPWVMSDTFVPDLDDQESALLLNEAKSLAFLELKQTTHPKAEQNAKRGWLSLQREKTKVPLHSALDEAPNFARRR